MHSLLIFLHLSNPLHLTSFREIVSCIGGSHEVQPSLLFVMTMLSAEEAFDHLRLALQDGDCLTVVDAVGGVVTTSTSPSSEGFEEIRCSGRISKDV